MRVKKRAVGGHDEAFPGDTYVADLAKSSKTDAAWVRLLPIAILLAILADWYFMQDTLATAMNWPALDSLSRRRPDYLSISLTLISSTAIIAIYLTIGLFAGKTLRKYNDLRHARNLMVFLFCLIVEGAAIAAFTYIRYQGEVVKAHAGAVADPLTSTGMMTIFMFLAALMMILYNAAAGDAMVTEIALDARKHLPEDRALYNATFARYAIDSDKDRAYETREREIDKRAIESAFRLSSIASQLNGILDPADAYEFQQVSRLAAQDYYE